MRAIPHHAVAALAAVSLAAGLAACGGSGDGDTRGSGEDGLSIGLLLPENQTTRYEEFDKPLIEARIDQLCDDCTLEYANAQNDLATQHRQANAMITQGIDVMILDAVEPVSLRSVVEEAREAGIPVLAYDRAVEGPVSAYVSFDSADIIDLWSRAILQSLGNRVDGAQIVRLEGPVINPDFLELPLLQGKAEQHLYQAAAWNAEDAYTVMTGAIAHLGPEGIDAVISSNDAIAGGVISALKDAHIEPMPPVIGQDAELAAVQRIIQGEQYMTVYKPYRPQADAAAEIALALGRDQDIDHLAQDRFSTATAQDIPSVILEPLSVTADNIEETIIEDGFYTVEQICTPEYQAACERAGLTE